MPKRQLSCLILKQLQVLAQDRNEDIHQKHGQPDTGHEEHQMDVDVVLSRLRILRYPSSVASEGSMRGTL